MIQPAPHSEGITRRGRWLWFLAPVMALTGCGTPVLDSQGSVGKAEQTILLNALAVMLVIVAPTILATLGFAWWFRASNERARYRPNWVYSGRIEAVVWSIPLLTVLFLGGMTWVGAHQLDPAEPLASKDRAIEVQVVSLDWKWLFIYPDQGVAAVNELVVPAGVPVHFRLTSASVMNAFFVPQLGSMIYTMNGMATQLNLQADRPGVYPGLSSHFSGDGFAGMHFMMRAVPPAAFANWVQTARATGPNLDPSSYKSLARQSSDVSPFTYRDVQPGLFQAILTQESAPGPAVQSSVTSPQAAHRGA